MLRRSPLYLATMPELLSSGLQPDKHALQSLLWEAASGVTFYSGKVKRRLPSALAFDAGDNTIRGLSQQQATNGTRWAWAASGGRIVRWYGPAAEQIIAAGTWQENATSIAEPTIWDFTHFGDWTVINSGLGKAQLFKQGTGVADYGDSPENTRKFMKKMNFMLAIGYGDRGTRVGWSDADNIEVFTGTAENLAGSISIDDFNTRIKAAHMLGQAISVYAEDQMALVSYISTPFIFGQKVVLDGIGAIGKAAVASDGKINMGVGRGGIWWTDSNSYRYIDEGYLHDYLQDNVNWDQGGKIVAIRNDYTGCYEFFFPMQASNIINEGWSYDPRTGGWSPIPAVSMKDERRLFGYALSGLQNGEIHYDQFASDDAPLVLVTRPLLSQARSADGLADVHTAQRVDEVELMLKEAVGVELRVGSAHEQTAEYAWTPWFTISPTQGTYKLDHMPDGVYHKLEFKSVVEDWALDLQGFILFGQVDGTKRSQQ